MAVTPVGNPYVESSDNVADFPGASEALAERIDIVGVNPFADAAARDAAIPSPVQGQMCSLNDDNKGYRYDGSAWVAVGAGTFDSHYIASQQNTSSTSYVDLSTVGPTVTLVTGTKALVAVTGWTHNPTNSAYSYVGYAVSGATTIAASDTTAMIFSTAAYIFRCTTVGLVTGLTAGSNTFTMKYRTNAGISYFQEREIFVQDMGS